MLFPLKKSQEKTQNESSHFGRCSVRDGAKCLEVVKVVAIAVVLSTAAVCSIKKKTPVTSFVNRRLNPYTP